MSRSYIRGARNYLSNLSFQAGNDKYDLERAEREAREKLLARRKLEKLTEKVVPQEQPEDVNQVPEDNKVQEDSESESSSEEDDQEDAVMADASEPNAETALDGQAAVVDLPDKPAGQGRGVARRQKHRERTRRKRKLEASEAAVLTSEGQKDKSKGRRKPRRGKRASEKQKPAKD